MTKLPVITKTHDFVRDFNSHLGEQDDQIAFAGKLFGVIPDNQKDIKAGGPLSLISQEIKNRDQVLS